VALPIALIGVEVGHAVANAIFGSPAEDGEVFASPTSGAGLLPPLLALALALILVGLGGRMAGWWWLPGRSRLVALPFACLPPVGFVLLELGEGFVHAGAMPWGSMLEPTFLVGLVLQVPFALAAYVIARVLLRWSDSVRRLILRRAAPPLLAPSRPSHLRPSDDRPSTLRRGWAYSGRAPPPLSLTASG
jgi:hypothetical protein